MRLADAIRLELSRLTGDTATTPEAFYRRACEAAAGELDVERVGVWFFVDGRSAIRCANLFERSKNEHSEGLVLRVCDFPAYFKSLQLRRSIPAEIAVKDPRTREMNEAYLQPLGIQSLLDAGIYQSGELVGVVCHEHIGPPREWTTEQRDFAGSIADLIALKIETARLQFAKTALAEFEKTEAVGTLVASAAHDFRNILAVVAAGATLILQNTDVPPAALKFAQQILQAADRGTNLVNSMAALGRDIPAKPAVIKPAAVLDALLPMLRTTIGPRYTVSFQPRPCSRVFFDRDHFERIILNLVLNARDAMPDGGRIALALDDEQIANGKRRGCYVHLSVADSGHGIDAAMLPRIFDPFFTTKPSPQGNGLGLAITRQFVEQAGGFIRVQSALGVGTTFRIYLPCVTRDTPTPPPKDANG